MLAGQHLDKTFREVDKFDKPDLEDARTRSTPTRDGDHLVFSDPETYEESIIEAETLGRNRLLPE
jgi:translation elongation factor P/translation initiation factor 5A